ncbi:MAG: hypothetical protein J3Q66DRAFT_362735 [Benniella sp.]|nr:MAG: hypothetical protein J3Q66DRAFT_362735 [Benniella sp.]
MADLIPDLAPYTHGLDPATFPLRIETRGEKGNVNSVRFVVVTLEKYTSEIAMNGQGYRVESFAPIDQSATSSESTLSKRQQEALSGMIFETIEALLMALSPGFEEFFGQELSRRLNAISWEQLERDREAQYPGSDDEDG